MTKKLYKTSEEIEAEAKQSGREYITYGYDFGSGKERFLTAEKRKRISELQKKTIDVEFDAFLDAVYAISLPQDLITLIEDTYYDKPLYSLAIAATGESIRLDIALEDLKRAQGNVEKQKSITEDLFAQICVAAFKGLIRDYYSVLLCVQDGYEDKASRSLMGNYRNFYQYAAIYAGDDLINETYISFIRLLNNISTDLKLIREYVRKYEKPERDNEEWLNMPIRSTMHSCEIMIGYANEYMDKVGK